MERTENGVVDRADALYKAGQRAQALALLEGECRQNPEDVLACVRLADLMRREGAVPEALDLYRRSAMIYADRGTLPFAIALYKLMVSLDAQWTQEESEGKSVLSEIVRRYQEAIRRGDRIKPQDRPEIPLLNELPPEALSSLIRQLTPLNRAVGETICRQGDEGSSLFIITRGYVQVLRRGRDGQDALLARLGPGDFFGEGSLLSEEARRSASVIAERDAELLELTAALLEALIKEYPSIARIMADFHHRRRLDNLLARVFPSLSAPERRRMAEHIDAEKRLPAQSLIYQEGDRSEYLSIIEHGSVAVLTHDLEGNELPLATLSAGQFFGEGGALTGTPRTATVRALTDVVLHNISRESLVTSLVHRPEILGAIQGVRAQRLEATLEKLQELDDPVLAPGLVGGPQDA